MPLKWFKYAMYFDGYYDDYVDIPMIVYGFPGLTIQEWVYFIQPKNNNLPSKHRFFGNSEGSMCNEPGFWYETDARYDYSALNIYWATSSDYSFYCFNTLKPIVYSIYGYQNMWINIAIRYDTSTNEYAIFLNGNKVFSTNIDASDHTVLNWNYPNCSDCPLDTYLGLGFRKIPNTPNIERDYMQLMEAQYLVYDRALSDSEILNNFYSFYNPVKDNLALWLEANPKYVKDINNDGLLEWINLSNYNAVSKYYDLWQIFNYYGLLFSANTIYNYAILHGNVKVIQLEGGVLR